MAKFLSEDEVRDNDKISLGFDKKENGVQQGTGHQRLFEEPDAGKPHVRFCEGQ